MKVLKQGIPQEWPIYVEGCINCEALVELEKDDLWRGWTSSGDEADPVAMWRCPQCGAVNQFEIEWNRLKLLPDRSEWKAPA